LLPLGGVSQAVQPVNVCSCPIGGHVGFDAGAPRRVASNLLLRRGMPLPSAAPVGKNHSGRVKRDIWHTGKKSVSRIATADYKLRCAGM